ncbi:hypothetical protein RJ639_003121 [Escallonia herrerae]|uniref:LOB domain-containing protein n=1 Tax=Escallonia herrerae TaxID=1293975 RepID=A0AA89AX15_9ASTE|nr:hypothetical protein RJ639_003121 [Escallonia herrerae]
MSNNSRSNGNTIQACAACKYQRRKCAPDCILAPYFPHHRQRQFLNAHKLFGVSNITKTIKNLSQPDRDQAMSTIAFQSDVRAADPVGGCYRMVRDLQHQIDLKTAELHAVLHHLALCRAQAAAQRGQQQQQHWVDMGPTCSYNEDREEEEKGMVAAVPLQEINPWGSNMQGPNSADLGGKQLPVSSSVDGCDVGEDIKPLLDVPEEDERHMFKFEFEDGIAEQRSDEAMYPEEKSKVKEEQDDSIQHAQDHDLKSAATFFTLTNSNI